MVQVSRSFCVLLALFVILGIKQLNGQVKVTSRSGIGVTVDETARTFSIRILDPAWTLEGKIDGTVSGARSSKGNDRFGSYSHIAFVLTHVNQYLCSIRIYDKHAVIVFQLQTTDSARHAPPAFPVFSRLPNNLYLTTLSENEFGAPPVFRLFDRSPDNAEDYHSGPLLLFDRDCNSCIISPASNFMIASIAENGTVVRCGLNEGLENIPLGFRESTIFVVEKGINKAWETWGKTLTQLYEKRLPTNDADVGLKYLGYWTDNGASYYYHYDLDKGYQGTLLDLKKHFDEAHVPIRYLQLDSWWYEKGYDNPDGSIEQFENRIQNFPAGNWNRFGGLLEYSPSTYLFPGGLRQFHDALDLPLITHNRWISRNSAYRSNYRISGIGAVDRRWWDDIVKSIHPWGVVTYEQDWLDRIYEYSPELSKTTWAGEAFMDGMAQACRREGLTMQYCMPLPRHYLQGGAKYDNLTTIRVSGDRFEKSRWKEFFYASSLAKALGIWPWCDVFMSRETPNILLATLSAGMVGIGDAIGSEDNLNISQSVRIDGVIVKPDAPIVPVDMSYLDEIDGKGILIASTFTDHGASLRTLYVFGYGDSTYNRNPFIQAELYSNVV